MKIGNMQVPDHVRIIISVPDANPETLEKLAQGMSESVVFTTNKKLKVIAKNQHVIVLEVQP